MAAVAADVPDELAGQFVDALARSSQSRVQRIEIDGRIFWLKRPERPRSLRWRLQKGDPRRAFEADLAGLRFLARHRIPAPAVVHSGREHFVTEDAGLPLHNFLRGTSEEEGAKAVAAAAATLAQLHQAGARHGRPKLRDICWDGKIARLIDLERFQARASPWSMGLDWAILLHSLLETEAKPGAAFAAAVRTYQAEAPAAAVKAGSRFIGLLGRGAPLLTLAQRVWPKHREIAAAARLPSAFIAV